MVSTSQSVLPQTAAIAAPLQPQEERASPWPARCWALASRVASAVADFFKAIGHAILQGCSRLKNTVFGVPTERKPNKPESVDQAAAPTEETHEDSSALPTQSQQKAETDHQKLLRLLSRGLKALEHAEAKLASQRAAH